MSSIHPFYPDLGLVGTSIFWSLETSTLGEGIEPFEQEALALGVNLLKSLEAMFKEKD